MSGRGVAADGFAVCCQPGCDRRFCRAGSFCVCGVAACRGEGAATVCNAVAAECDP